ncbi:MAG: M48 family metalloprotease, partial [Candidatus Omnitrophica bacterium]|nr:M48 family metalloprotease [Candidatus Omnitrophota bacterium]
MKKLFLLSSIFYFLTSIFLISGCMTTEYNLGTHTQDIYFFSTEKEVAMGKNVARQVAKELQISSNPYDIKRIEEIAKKITEVSDRQELNYYFYVIDKEDKQEEMINAFSLPGGYIYIFKDLLDILDEDELAFVLAHEMAHIVSRHHIKRLQAAMGYNLLLVASTVAPSDDNFSGGLSFALAQIMSAHSREDEFN